MARLSRLLLAASSARAEDWSWSSVRVHLSGRSDGLTDLAAMAGIHRNWRAMLRRGLEAGHLDTAAEAAIEAHERTGRPWGSTDFVAALEWRTGRRLAPQKRGPKPKHAEHP